MAYMLSCKQKTDICLTDSFLGQPGYASSRKVKPFWITTRQEVMGLGMAVALAGPQANSLKLAQTDNHTKTPHRYIFTD